MWQHCGPGAWLTFLVKDSMSRSGTGVAGWQGGGKGPTTRSWRSSTFQVPTWQKRRRKMFTGIGSNLLFLHLCYHTVTRTSQGLRVGGRKVIYYGVSHCLISSTFQIYFVTQLWYPTLFCYLQGSLGGMARYIGGFFFLSFGGQYSCVQIFFTVWSFFVFSSKVSICIFVIQKKIRKFGH